MRLNSVGIDPDETTVYFTAADSFGGHWIEARLSPRGKLEQVSLC